MWWLGKEPNRYADLSRGPPTVLDGNFCRWPAALATAQVNVEPSGEKEACGALHAVLHILLNFARAFARRPLRLAVALAAEGRIVE